MFAFLGSRSGRLLERSVRSRACWTGCILAAAFLIFGRPMALPPGGDGSTLPAGGGPRLTGANTLPAEEVESLRIHGEPTIRRGGPIGFRVAVLDNTEAWKRLPQVERGDGQHLPVWARVLSATLPHTTAAMLELDFRHRARSPLEPKLRGRLRWVAAHANNCRYSEDYAAADLRRIGVDENSIRQLAGNLHTFPMDTQMALQFARKLTRDGSSVTDEEVAQLVARYGEHQVVAMVLLLAYASFQDRLILALGLPVDSGEPLPPVEVCFVRPRLGVSRAAPRRKAPRRDATVSLTSQIADAERLALDFAAIQKRLAEQKIRNCRIPLPGDIPDAPRWGLVCRAYQPELADAWSACAKAFGEEANQDPIFEESVFWVITRAIGCFY